MNLKLNEVRFTTKMVAGVILLIFLTILIITTTNVVRVKSSLIELGKVSTKSTFDAMYNAIVLQNHNTLMMVESDLNTLEVYD